MRRGFALATLLAIACRSSTEPAAPRLPDSSASAPAPAPPAASTPAPVTGPDDEGAAAAAGAVDVATGKRGAVTSAERQATAVGRAILERGGNAVDAAVAVGFALGVTHPSAGNMGGGGFMVLRRADGKVSAIDYREVAPGKASRDMYLDKDGAPTDDSVFGPRAAGIPGDVAGFALAHEKYGSLPWKDLVAPAIALARDGHELDDFHAKDMEWATATIETHLAEVIARPGKRRQDAALAAALRETLALFRRADGTALRPGDRMVQPALAATLQAIADGGAAAFYRGRLGKKLATEVTRMGGLWTATDLRSYRAIERTPLEFDYRGNRVITMPPPSAGGITMRQLFAASEILELASKPWDSVDRIHLTIEAMRRVYADRNQLVADPAFVDVPLARLIDIAYLRQRMGAISRTRATPSAEVGAGLELVEKPQTTHFSVVDGAGMAVANTYTLNGGFGAKVVVPGTGVLLNNEMDDFTAKVGAANMFGLVQGPQNAIAPGKRMVSSMSPTIVTTGGELRLVCGSPGGPTITTTVAQIVLQVLDHGVALDRAIAATRLHHQWLPDVVFHEDTLPPATAAALTARGHALKSRGRIGHANCIEVGADGTLRAVADSGRDGGDADAF